MIIAIIAITGFQVYWLKNNYAREKQSLELKTSSAFQETVMSLQASRLKIANWDYTIERSGPLSERIFRKNGSLPSNGNKAEILQPGMSLINILQEKMKDSIIRDSAASIIISYSNSSNIANDSIRRLLMPALSMNPLGDSMPGRGRVSIRNTSGQNGNGNQIFRLMYNVDSVFQADSVKVEEIETAYHRRLKEEGLNIPFQINRIEHADQKHEMNDVVIGFSRPVTYRLSLSETFPYILRRLALPILFSFFLVGISLVAFVLLYKNLVRQQRLSHLKNDFISNITHELKTPIATMGVAIEALKNFNAINDTRKTTEYLDISQNELQRLSLLVDKVLKLSMFGRKEMELKFEPVDMKAITEEVVNSMRLQIEKAMGTVNVEFAGETVIEGDRLHLLSVIFNLLDNALKYSSGRPVISIAISGGENEVMLTMRDNGIGIPPEYRKRVFEKFFRVPTGNTHNAKGYGLGLSYAHDVVRKHGGSINAESVNGDGAAFIITLPKRQQ